MKRPNYESKLKRYVYISIFVVCSLFLTYICIDVVIAQTVDFLAVPYFGGHYVTSWFDHQHPTYARNGLVEIYNGLIARETYGVCGHNSQGQAIAYYSQPGGGGNCTWYDGHPGIDFNLNYETILASANGNVIQAGWWDFTNRFSGLGLRVEIDHGNGYSTHYGHLSAAAASLNEDVTKGQVIGTSGNTGNSNGAHLHFEVRSNNSPTDPFGGSGSSYLWQGGSWQLGQWLGQKTMVYGTARIIDDGDIGFSKGRKINGNNVSCPPESCPYWYPINGVGTNGDMTWTYTSSIDADYWVRWIPQNPGLYEVQVYVPGSYSTTWGARYCLITSYYYYPTACRVADQNGATNKWLDLGIHRFGTHPSAPYYGIWIDDLTGEATAWSDRNKIGIDAVRFRVPNPIYLPAVMRQ